MQTEPEVPIACTLPSTALSARLAKIGQLTERSLLSHRLEGSALRLKYRTDVAAELEQLVDAERECCGFLRFDLYTAADGVELTIQAPVGTDSEAQWLFSQFLPVQTARRQGCGCAPGRCGAP